VPIAVIALDFDPILRLGDVTIRWQTVALAGIVFASLCLAALLARRGGLRGDDLLFVVVGTVPGAVIGGRLGYVLGHADFYAANPGAIVDPGQGAVTLSLAVAGGTLTGAIVARLLGTSIRSWLQVAALPALVAIGFGKLAMVLGGSGQGIPADLTWATAYLGPGPWGSLAPEIPSHPAQVYEAIAALTVLAGVAVAFAVGVFREWTGRAFLIGIALWAVGRAVVGFSWRDAMVLGPLGVEQLLTLAVAATFLVLAFVPPVPAGEPATLDDSSPRFPEWPDPATRPRF
jgi:phosphatidylglycerol---prolipoprotein diacylglyceryl transferase